MSPNRIAFVAAVSLSLVLGSVDASAQERNGFSFGVGAGLGSADATCDDCGSGDRETSGSGYLKGGYALNEHLLLGVEFNLWTKTYDVPGFDNASSTVNVYNVSGTMTFYPQASSGLFLKGGAGVSLLDLELKASGSTLTADVGKGPGLIVGAGYDIPVGRHVAITPAVNFWYGQIGDVKVLGESLATGWKHNVIDFTVGITFP